MGAFYTYHECHFISIPLSDLRVGDDLAYGYGSSRAYGIVRVTAIFPNNTVEYSLPAGARARSDGYTDIVVQWRGREPLITIYQQLKREMVMVKC